MLSPPPCPHLRSEWVGLPETQHFWNLNTYLHARPLNPGSFYGHIFALLKAVYSILHLDFEAKIIIFFGITYLAIRGGLSFNRIFIWIRSLQTFTTWHFHLLLLLLLQWCYSNSRGDQQKVNIFAKKNKPKEHTRKIVWYVTVLHLNMNWWMKFTFIPCLIVMRECLILAMVCTWVQCSRVRSPVQCGNSW